MQEKNPIYVRHIKECRIPWFEFQAGRTEFLTRPGFTKIPIFRLLGWGDNEERAVKMAELNEKRKAQDGQSPPP